MPSKGNPYLTRPTPKAVSPSPNVYHTEWNSNSPVIGNSRSGTVTRAYYSQYSAKVDFASRTTDSKILHTRSRIISASMMQNDGRDVPGFSHYGASPTIRNIYALQLQKQILDSPTSTSPVLMQSSNSNQNNNLSLNTATTLSYFKRPITAPSNMRKLSNSSNYSNRTSFLKDAQVVLPKRPNSVSTGSRSRPKIVSPTASPEPEKCDFPQQIPTRSPKDVNKSGTIRDILSTRPHTTPCPTRELTGCLKNAKAAAIALEERPKSRSNNVNFAPDTRNIQRENKPKKMKMMRNNRKPKFAHSCCGHFLPPAKEVIAHLGPEGLYSNVYTRFTTVWCNPFGRTSNESVTKINIRFRRFRKLLDDLSKNHERFNDIEERLKAKFMIEQILPRYISALDIALMDVELDHVEQLLSTIASSLRIFQVNLHDLFFEPDGKPKEVLEVPPDNDGFLVKLGPVIFTLNRISGDQIPCNPRNLSIEPLLVKLQLELLILAICPVNCLMFRCLIAVAPNTATQCLQSLDKLRNKNLNYCIKWVNDSVMHRDYMSILKCFGLCDESGARDGVPIILSQATNALEVLND